MITNIINALTKFLSPKAAAPAVPQTAPTIAAAVASVYRKRLDTFDEIVDDLTDLFPYDLDNSSVVHNRAAEVFKAEWTAGPYRLRLRVSGADSFEVSATNPDGSFSYNGRYQDASDIVIDEIADVADEIGNALRDDWSDFGSEYGYADQNFVGIDTFEDEKGMAEILKRTGLPEDWIVVKVVNFTDASLKVQKAWLEENCEGAFKRVNWAEGCSTKLAVGFELGEDAVLYRLRWR